ncbi:MAG: hypothetical protein H8E66_34645 [Planctomycetes bacterium]|nr:hypothetical protein [Planctomycetota bacterium]
MSRVLMIAVAVSFVTTAAPAAEKIVSGPQAGEKVTGFFDFSGVKCGGATDRYAVGTKPRYY